MSEPKAEAVPSIYSFKPDTGALAAKPGTSAYEAMIERVREFTATLPQTWTYATEDGEVWQKVEDGPWERIIGGYEVDNGDGPSRPDWAEAQRRFLDALGPSA